MDEQLTECERIHDGETCLDHGVSQDRACALCRRRGWPQQTESDRKPKDLDPTMLDGGFTTDAGVTAWNIGEDGDVLLLGHHDDDAAWAAYVAWSLWYVGEEPHDSAREVYDITRRYAAFSDHSEGCDLVECHCEEEACEACRTGNHDGCTEPDYCECATGYDHDFKGPWPCRCECYCDEYSWWVSTTKSGHEVTWISFSYEKSKALRDAASRPGQSG